MADDYTDPLDAARRRMVPQRTAQSFFPAVNQRMFSDRSDLLQDVDQSFYGGGQAFPTATPTPTPTPRPRSYFGGVQFPQLPSLTGYTQPPVPRPSSTPFTFPTPSPSPAPTNPWDDWNARYGFNF